MLDRGAKPHKSSKDPSDPDDVLTIAFYSQNGTRLLSGHVHENGTYKLSESRAGKGKRQGSEGKWVKRSVSDISKTGQQPLNSDVKSLSTVETSCIVSYYIYLKELAICRLNRAWTPSAMRLWTGTVNGNAVL